MMVKKVWHWLVAKWWVLPVGVTIWVVGWYLILWNVPLRPSVDADHIIYFTVVDLLGTSLFILPVVVMIVVSIVYALYRKSIWRGIGLTVLTMLIALGSLFIALKATGYPNRVMMSMGYSCYYEYRGEFIEVPHLEHVESAYLSGRVYNLLRYNRFPCSPIDLRQYNLYECDLFGVLCQVIHRETIIGSNLNHVIADQDNPPKLIVDGDKLLLYIAGERVYATQ